MLFLCFAVKDRFPLINDFNQYIGNFGIETWYDRRNIFLGENRLEQNIENGAKNPSVNYAIVFYSENFVNGNICIDEFETILDRYNKKELYLFPVFLGNVPHEIDSKFKICKELVYKQINSSEEFLGLSLHVVAKIINDQVSNLKYKTIKDYLFNMDKSILLFQLLREYENIDKKNYAMRIGSLFNIFKVLTFGIETDYMYYKTMHFIFYQNCYSPIKEEKRELQIMENIVLSESTRLFPVL